MTILTVLQLFATLSKRLFPETVFGPGSTLGKRRNPGYSTLEECEKVSQRWILSGCALGQCAKCTKVIKAGILGVLRARVMIGTTSGFLHNNPSLVQIWPDSPVRYPINTRSCSTRARDTRRHLPLFRDHPGQSYPILPTHPGFNREVFDRRLLSVTSA